MTTFTIAWNTGFEGAPADADLRAEGAARIRDHRKAVRERAEIDHIWGGASDVDSGEHKQVTFSAPVADPTNVANKGFLYIKDVASKAELHWRDEDGNVLQLTAAGVLAGIAGADPATALTNQRQTWTEPQRSAIATPSFSTTMTLDLNNGPDFDFTATANFVLANPSNITVGQKGSVRVRQDAGGSRVISSLGSFWKTPNDGEGVALITTASRYDVLHYWVMSTTEILLVKTADPS